MGRRPGYDWAMRRANANKSRPKSSAPPPGHGPSRLGGQSPSSDFGSGTVSAVARVDLAELGKSCGSQGPTLVKSTIAATCRTQSCMPSLCAQMRMRITLHWHFCIACNTQPLEVRTQAVRGPKCVIIREPVQLPSLLYRVFDLLVAAFADTRLPAQAGSSNTRHAAVSPL